MNEITNNITSLGLIATIVSIIFAGASLAISHRRKAQHREQHAAPTPLNLPASIQQEPPRPVLKRPGAAPVAPPVAAAYETGATSSPLFRRLGRVGGMETTADSPETTPNNQMDWE